MFRKQGKELNVLDAIVSPLVESDAVFFNLLSIELAVADKVSLQTIVISRPFMNSRDKMFPMGSVYDECN